MNQAHIVREGMSALNEFVRIDTTLHDAITRLEAVSESPRLDAELLLARALDVARSYLFAHPEDQLDPAAGKRFWSAVEQRADGVPLAYITGEKEFWSMMLAVNRDTLVPRPETEILVEEALGRIPRRAEYTILDLGTGSGAIALALAKERPLCSITASDISQAALHTASENARQHNLPNIDFVHGRWFDPLAGRSFDLIVSNPPYIPDDDPDLAKLHSEPVSALVSGADGLDAIRHIASYGRDFLETSGVLLLEHGDSQQESVAALLDDHGWKDISVANDLAGKPRVAIANR